MKTNTKHYHLVLFGILLMVGIILERYFSDNQYKIAFGYYIIVGLSNIIAICISFLKQRCNIFTILCGVLFLYLGFIASHLESRQFQESNSILKNNHTVSGKIYLLRDYGDFKQLLIKSTLPKNIHPTVLVNVFNGNTDFYEGQFVTIFQPPATIPSPKNPFEFNAKSYWRRYKVSYQVDVNNSSSIEISPRPKVNLLQKSNAWIADYLDFQYHETSKAGLLKALILGDKTDVSERDKNNFKTIGALHILAVSGLHVGIISYLFYILCAPIYLIFKNKKIIFLLTGLAIWFYAFLTGMKIPIVRASIVVTLFLVSKILERKTSSWILLSWAAITVLLWQPKDLFTVSFQLSFAAVASIITFQKPISKSISKFTGKNKLTNLIAVSMAAQIGTWPILLWHFHQFSYLSLLSSLVIIPLLFPLLMTTLLGLFFSQIAISFGAPFVTGSSAIIDIIQFLSSQLAPFGNPNHYIVFRPEMIALISGIIIISGISLNFRFSIYRFVPILLSLGILLEIINTYTKRNQTVVNVYHGTNPVVDIYKNGICFTNQIEISEPYLGKNRSKFKISKTKSLPMKKQDSTLVKGESQFYKYSHKNFSVFILDIQKELKPIRVNNDKNSKFILTGKTYLLKDRNKFSGDSTIIWNTFTKGFYRKKIQ